MKNHEVIHTGSKDFVCNVCNRAFARKISLDDHMLTHLEGDSFKCVLCPKSFAADVLLQRHLRRQHTPNETYMHLLNSIQSQLWCTVCGEQFTLKKNLERHMLMHAGAKSFSCNVCGKEFSRKASLDLHFVSQHSDVKPFACELCDLSFSLKVYLVRHVRSQHSNERPFSCDDCGKGFVDKSDLKKHRVVHTGQLVKSKQLTFFYIKNRISFSFQSSKLLIMILPSFFP